jgi:hypothetical protein
MYTKASPVSSFTSTLSTEAGINALFITSLISSQFAIISIFSQLNSSITDFTLIHFWPIRVQTASICS